MWYRSQFSKALRTDKWIDIEININYDILVKNIKSEISENDILDTLLNKFWNIVNALKVNYFLK